MKAEVLRRISAPVDRFGIAPDRMMLLETAQNATGPHGNGQRRMNLRQCVGCLAWHPLSAGACPRCQQTMP